MENIFFENLVQTLLDSCDKYRPFPKLSLVFIEDKILEESI